MQYKGMLFDFDGTLLDTNDLILDTFQHVIEPKFPGKYTREQLQKFIGPSLRESFLEVDPHNVDALIEEYITWNRLHHDDLVKEFPYVVEVLESLKADGVKLAIVSTKRREAVIRGLNILGITDLFDSIVSNDDVKHVKPDPEPVLLAMEQLHLNKVDVLMIGDNHHDIEGGQNAGVHTAGVAWSIKGAAYLEQFNPTYMLETMKDLLRISSMKIYA